MCTPTRVVCGGSMWKQQRLGVLGGAAEVRSSACVPTLADSLLDLAGTTMEDVEAVTDSRRGQSTLTDFYPARKAPSQKITKPLEGTSKLSPSPRTSEQACSDPQAGKENDSHVCPPPPRTTPRFQSLMSRLQKNAKEFENGVPWQRFTGNVLSSARRSHGRIISRSDCSPCGQEFGTLSRVALLHLYTLSYRF